MIPTREEVQNKINEFQGMQSDKQQGVSTWLDSIDCPLKDKEMILSDLVTYENY
jgi:hypothetical protein